MHGNADQNENTKTGSFDNICHAEKRALRFILKAKLSAIRQDS